MKSNMQVIIPMSGEGKRFQDAGYQTPKPFIKIDKFCMINHVLKMLNGFKDYLIIGKESHLSEKNKKKIYSVIPDLKLVSLKKNKLGPVMALKKYEHLISDEKEIIISYCDFFSKFQIKNFVSFVKKNNSYGAIATYTGFHPHMLGNDNYAYIVKKKNFEVKKIFEKKSLNKNKFKEIASNGLYYFKSGKLLKEIINEYISRGPMINNEYYISLLFNFIIQKKLKVNYYMVDNMCQWGTPTDLENFKDWYFYFKSKNNSKKKIKINDTIMLMPMAGIGKRFSHKGYKVPKPLIKIDDKYMFHKAIDDLPEFSDYKFVTLGKHNLDKIIKKKIKNSKILSLKKKTDGQARSCMLGIKHFNIGENQKIFITACDNGAIYSNKYLLNLINDENIDIVVWTSKNFFSAKKNPEMYSWVNVDKNNFVKNVSVKKFNEKDPINSHVFIGSVLFKKAKYFIEGFKMNVNKKITSNNEYYLDEVINRNIEMSLKIKIFEVQKYICWGTPDDYKTYLYWNNFFNSSKIIF